MKLFLNKVFLFLLTLLIVQCSAFLKGGRLAVNSNITQSDKIISYELIGWQGKENKMKATEILKVLHKSNRFKEISHYVKSDYDLKIQIILEDSPEFSILLNEPVQPVSWMIEKYPERYGIYLLNRLASIATRLIIPVVRLSEDRITFKVWKFNQKIAEYSYNIEIYKTFGWLSLILIPFDDRKEIKEIYKDYALKFLNDSENIYDQSKE